jgi:hypothetical protein
MKGQPLYKEDWIGLKRLDEEKRLHTIQLDGEHTELNSHIIKLIIDPYILQNPEGWIDSKN